MAQVIYARRALDDLERLLQFLERERPGAGPAAAAVIADGIGILERHPLIGRPVEHDLRELLISRGRSGYAALYCFLAAHDVALVLAIRHQREAGYADQP
ncbi:MAG: type II toxin-antitoxin system RelE/ParE family toxin [Steroidobacteraceae bacterium]|mgnify:CR=1 FL=1